MKIKSIYISAFGGLKDKHLDFSDGFNIIYGDNENGKSTVMAFIKMMFYGTERGSAQLSKNPRKKYTPWDGSSMAGSVDFELENKNYRIEREFKSSNSTDKVTVTDLDLGEKTAAPPDVGLQIFGLSAAAFERSVFVGQSGIPENDSSAEGEINSRLSNMVSSADESVSYDTVEKRITKAKLALMSKRGQAGEYDKNLKRLDLLSDRLKKAELIYEEHEQYKENAAALSSQIESGLKRISVIKAKLKEEQNIKDAEKLKKLLETKEELDELNRSLRLSDGGLIDEQFVSKLRFCISRLENIKVSYDAANGEAQRLRENLRLTASSDNSTASERSARLAKEVKTYESDIAAVKNEIKENGSIYNELSSKEYEIKTKRKGINVPLAVISLLLFSLAAVFVVLRSYIVSAVFVGLFILLLCLSFVLRPYDKKAIEEFSRRLNEVKLKSDSLKEKESELFRKYTAASAGLEAFGAALGNDSALLKAQEKQLAESEERAENMRLSLENAEEELKELFSRYKSADNTETIKEQLDGLAKKAAAQKEIKQRLNYLAKDLENISYEEARHRLEALPENAETEDFTALKAELEKITGETAERKQALIKIETEDREKLKNAEEPETLKKEIADLKAVTKKQLDFCNAADIALDTLKDSFAEMRRSYGSALEKKAGGIFEALTDGKYSGMQISKSFEINADKNGIFGGKELAFLSSGTIDQAYLSLRLALSELMFENSERLPVFLDDALSQYDDLRTKTALKYLKEYSENGQIIMFTCHRFVTDYAADTGAVCKDF